MTLIQPFASWNSFETFAYDVRHRTRFLHDDRVNLFLSAVTESAVKRCSNVSEGKALWRAQIGHDFEERFLEENAVYDEPVPFSAERMKPLRGSAHEGRVNPRGIPCLYAASDKETAVSEVRPWLGALVSVARMNVVRKLRLVNCTEGHDSKFDFYFEEPAVEEREICVWQAIARAFSEPATPDPGVAEYVPTQILAEHLRKLGYDGVVYKSKLGGGLNIALFDLDVLEVVDVRLYPVKAVHCEIGDMQSSYVVKHKPSDAQLPTNENTKLSDGI